MFMDNFIGTLVFILPGFLMYFWIQSFGVNPVTKHSTVELTAISALLWFPVSVATIFLYNGLISLASVLVDEEPIWTIPDLRDKSEDLAFLAGFLFMSLIVSFVFSVFWAKWGHKMQLAITNKVRKWRGAVAFSNNASVWDEVFLKDEAQVVEIGKIDGAGQVLIGEILKASRTFESERLSLHGTDLCKKIIEKYKVPVQNIYYDIKSGTYVKIYDADSFKEGLEKHRGEDSTSS